MHATYVHTYIYTKSIFIAACLPFALNKAILAVMRFHFSSCCLLHVRTYTYVYMNACVCSKAVQLFVVVAM